MDLLSGESQVRLIGVGPYAVQSRSEVATLGLGEQVQRLQRTWSSRRRGGSRHACAGAECGGRRLRRGYCGRGRAAAGSVPTIEVAANGSTGEDTCD